MASSENKDLQYDIRFIKPALRRHYVQLTEHLKAAEVLPEFFANGIITLETKQELDCVLEKSGSIKFSRAVVDKLLETSYSPEDLKKVLDILESKQETLYGSILKWISDLEACEYRIYILLKVSCAMRVHYYRSAVSRVVDIVSLNGGLLACYPSGFVNFCLDK